MTRAAWRKRTPLYVFYICKSQDFVDAIMIEALIWIYKNYSEKMKKLKKNEILIMHQIFFSRDTYD